MIMASKIVLFILLCSILLLSCGPATAVPTSTVVATNTLLPTITNLPEPSATATLSQVEKIFTIPTRQAGLVDTPTPIATPSVDSSSVKLKDLSEHDALNFIDTMNKYSYQNFPSFDDWWTDGQFIASQEPVALAIQEYLYRFPESYSANRLRWQLAFIDSISLGGVNGNAYDAQWILDELQKNLNQGTVSPNELENVLDQFWLDVAYYQPVENLFGDGKTAWFYVISPQVWEHEETHPKSSDYFGHGGLFFVVQEINVGEFRVHLLERAWNFSSGSSSLFEISDRNENGIPEIALNLWLHSGTMCAGSFKIFEWKDNAFVDLTKGEMQIGDCGDRYEYSQVGGKLSIIFHKTFARAPAIYTWNGNYYEFSGYQYSNLVEKWSSAQSPSEEAEAIEEILALKDKEGLNLSHIDFLRYRLGMAYALNSDALRAKRVLQDLADNPLDKSRTVYSKFAKDFLRYYFGDQSLALACKKSREIFDKTIDSLSQQDEEELFGISFDFTFGVGMLRCFDRDVFEILINKMPGEIENVAGELRKDGIDLFYAEKQDVNLDGLSEEWVIIFDDGIFVVVPDGSRYKAVELEYFWYGEDVTRYLKVDVNISHWAGIQESVMTVSTDENLEILGIGTDYTSTELGYGFDVKDVLFSSQSTPPGYQVFYIKPKLDKDYYGVPWDGYRWDSKRQTFRDDLFEYTLFVERDPNKARDLADVVLPILMDWKNLDSVRYWLPRYFYLCGLSYELSDNMGEAAQVYWQLWHDFPESSYALLAKYKLEPVKP